MSPQQCVARILIKEDKKAKCWIAECVDFDMVTQAKKREDLPKAFGHVYYGTIILALEAGEEPEFRPCPKSIRSRWEKMLEAGKLVSEVIPWSRFIPDWWPEAYKRVKDFRPISQPQELVLGGAR